MSVWKHDSMAQHVWRAVLYVDMLRAMRECADIHVYMYICSPPFLFPHLFLHLPSHPFLPCHPEAGRVKVRAYRLSY